MDKREVGFTQGVGWAIAFEQQYYSGGEQIAKESGIKLSDFEKCCDEQDLQYIRKLF